MCYLRSTHVSDPSVVLSVKGHGSGRSTPPRPAPPRQLRLTRRRRGGVGGCPHPTADDATVGDHLRHGRRHKGVCPPGHRQASPRRTMSCANERVWRVRAAPRPEGAGQASLGARAVRGAGRWRTCRVGQPFRPALSWPSGRPRAKAARSAAQQSPPGPPALDGSDECDPSGTVNVAPSRRHLPAQAACARSEAQPGGHGGWPTARVTRRGCCVPRGVAGEAPGVARSGDE